MLNNYLDKSMGSLFVLRRAWLFGICRRADINKAFGTESSPNRAAKIMADALRRYPKHLRRIANKGIVPVADAPWPEDASPEAVLDAIARHEPAEKTGVFTDPAKPEERGVSWLQSSPAPSRTMSPEGTRVLMQAIVKDEPLSILYAGLRHHETPRWRRIAPRAMEHTGIYWRLFAQDLDDAQNNWPIKCFVIGRIAEARKLEKNDTPAYTARSMVKESQYLKVHFSDKLTSEQMAGLMTTFNISPDGKLSIPSHAVHGFCREYANTPHPDHIVWPVFTRIDQVE